MAELTLVEAINDCLHVELRRDPNVLVMGEDVGTAGGVFRATAGLRETFGEDRCVDTPLAEAGILGTAVGLCMAGWRPVCEMQYDAFSYPCLDQLINHVGRYRWRTSGGMEFPITIRMPYGGGVRAPELHDDSPEAYYVHTPGVKVAIPATPADAKGLLAAAIRDPDPVVIFEPKLLYRTTRGEVPDGEHVVPLGQARVAREGTDVTLVAYGAMVPLCERAADELAGEASRRGARPADAEAARRGRAARVGGEDRAASSIVQEAPRTCGYGAEIAAILAEKAILDLRGPGAPRDRLRRPLPVLEARGRVHAVGRRASPTRCGSCSRSEWRSTRSRSSARTLHGHFSRDLEPVLTVDSGRLGRVPRRSTRAGGSSRRRTTGERRRFEPRDDELDAGHALVGPIEVRGARAGQTLAVRVDEVRVGTLRLHDRAAASRRRSTTASALADGETRTLVWSSTPTRGSAATGSAASSTCGRSSA